MKQLGKKVEDSFPEQRLRDTEITLNAILIQYTTSVMIFLRDLKSIYEY
jgi:hypothetical protein